MKYISVLGEICVDILQAVSLRSVGKNPDKAKSFSGILGITFLKSSEMAEEMYASMCCRGVPENTRRNRNTKCVCTTLYIF